MTAQPLTDPLLAALVAAQARADLFAPLPATVVVAVSGGADSVCLLDALAALAAPWSLTLHVAHVDHGLRLSSAGDARFVRELALARDLPFHALTVGPGELERLPGGREAAARQVRQRFFYATALAVTPPGQVAHIALAHHAEDQAETLLLHLVQGSGLRGLGAMRPVHIVRPDELPVGAPEVRVVRPLLALRRALLRDYLTAHGLTWCEDPTNADVAIARNRVRHAVLPQLAHLNPAVVDLLGRTAELLAGEATRLELLDGALLERLCVAPPSPVRIVLDLDGLRRSSVPDQRGIVRHAFALLMPASDSASAPLRELGFQQIEALRAHLSTVGGATGPHPLAGGIAWSVASARHVPFLRLSLHRAGALPFLPDHPYLGAGWREEQGCLPIQAGVPVSAGDWQLVCAQLPVHALPSDWQKNADPWCAYLDAGAAATPCLTTPLAGMRVAPLGMGGRTRALGDLFTDRKAPASLRAGWPLVVDAASGAVLWVCGLQPAHSSRITPATERVLCCVWMPQQ